MPTYVALLQFTHQGIQNVHESPHRAESFKRGARKAGVKVSHLLWTLGAYDGVLVMDGPDDATVAGLVVSLASLGNVRITTLTGFNAADFSALSEKAPKL